MHIAQNWRLKSQRYRLAGEVCEHCGAKIFPPRDVCPNCSHPAKARFEFSGRGEVYSFSAMHETAAEFQRFRPFTMALVKLEEGPLVTAQLTDVEPEEVSIGMPVEMVTRRLTEEGKEGIILYGYKFRPALQSIA